VFVSLSLRRSKHLEIKVKADYYMFDALTMFFQSGQLPATQLMLAWFCSVSN